MYVLDIDIMFYVLRGHQIMAVFLLPQIEVEKSDFGTHALGAKLVSPFVGIANGSHPSYLNHYI